MSKSKINVFFATETGNAESLATLAGRRAVSEGWEAAVQSVSDIAPSNLGELTFALFFASTWGDGEPPTSACDFWERLEREQPDLSRLSYAVFGLGDREYPEFNAFGRKLDERLAVLGAKRLAPRVEADLDYDANYAEWELAIFATLAAKRAA